MNVSEWGLDRMRIYAEWTLDGVFNNGFFTTWDAYHAATFNPDIEIKVVKVLH